MSKDNCVPICLFVYNRLEETKKTIKALQNNFLAKESDLFIYSDGGKTQEDKEKVCMSVNAPYGTTYTSCGDKEQQDDACMNTTP